MDDYNSDKRDAERYRYIKKNMEWRRSGSIDDENAHAFIGCRFPYSANFGAKTMLDYHIDKMIEANPTKAE